MLNLIAANANPMDESSITQNRRNRRATVLMAATLELSGGQLAVKLRNLSAEGALVEGDHLPVEGSELMFCKGDLSVPGRIAWSEGRRAGIAFSSQLEPEQLLRHVPAPQARVKPAFRRPGFGAHEFSPEERRFAEEWVWSKPVDLRGD
jgi:hypothetical protein